MQGCYLLKFFSTLSCKSNLDVGRGKIISLCKQTFSSFKLCFLQVCDCIMNSGAQAQAHLTGTKHRHRMDKVELGRSLLDKVGWGDCCVIYWDRQYLYSPFLHPTRYIPLIFIKTHDNL